MSRKRIPCWGKSGTSLIRARSRATRSGSAARAIDQLPERLDQQQVLEPHHHSRRFLDRLDPLPPPLRAAGAQRRGEKLIEQLRLPLGRRAQEGEVAGHQPEPRQLGRRPHHLPFGLVEVPLAAAAGAAIRPNSASWSISCSSTPSSAATSASSAWAPAPFARERA